ERVGSGIWSGPRREVKARPRTYQNSLRVAQSLRGEAMVRKGALVSDAVPHEHGALAPRASVATARRGAVANQFDGVDARALPAQIAAEMERLVVYADAQ